MFQVSRFIFLLLCGIWGIWTLSDCTFVPEYKVILDPGHGGANITIDGRFVKSERWNPIQKKYTSHYLTGMESDGYKEHLVMLDLAKRLHYYLNLTMSPWGWEKFVKLLHKFAAIPNRKGKDFIRIRLQSKLTRLESWNHLYSQADQLSVNNRYRLYDYPDQRGRLRPGRLSFINHHHPSLVVSLHMTPAGFGNQGGMAAVLAPGFQSYDLVRRIHLKQESPKKWRKSPWNGKILETERGWSQFQLMRGDAWGYFHGYRSNRRGTVPNWAASRGIRHNLVSWVYKESENWHKSYNPNQSGPYALKYQDFQPKGKFWDRERSQAERWRREGGVLGYGGDNHYASDQLMRFVQYGVRRLEPDMRASSGKIGKIRYPFVSSYALPIYVNAITAFLEIGYLNRKRDRDLIIGKMEAVAQSIAVGIYSLYTGISLKTLPSNPFPPRSQALDFEKYHKLPQGDYFSQP